MEELQAALEKLPRSLAMAEEGEGSAPFFGLCFLWVLLLGMELPNICFGLVFWCCLLGTLVPW